MKEAHQFLMHIEDIPIIQMITSELLIALITLINVVKTQSVFEYLLKIYLIRDVYRYVNGTLSRTNLHNNKMLPLLRFHEYMPGIQISLAVIEIGMQAYFRKIYLSFENAYIC